MSRSLSTPQGATTLTTRQQVTTPSPQVYRTVDGDMVDAIAWKHYGSERAAVAIFEANPRLADHGPMLPGGLRIVLPLLNLGNTTPESTFINLWD